MIITTYEGFRDLTDGWDFSQLAFDTETTDLDWWELKIEGFSISNGKQSCYVNLSSDEELAEWILSWFVHRLSETNLILIGHNLVFDLKVLAKYVGIETINHLMMRTKLADTCTASYLIDERCSHKLKGPEGSGHCCERFLGRQPVSYDEAIKYGVLSPEFAEYAEADSVNTFDLWQSEKPILERDGLMNVFEVEMDFLPVQIEMELTGMVIDTDRLMVMETELDLIKCSLEADLIEVLDPPDQGYMFGIPIEATHINSPTKLLPVLQEKYGLKGKSTDKKALTSMLGKHPIFELILKYRAVSKLLSTYIVPTWDRIRDDKRIHPSFRSARSGRLQARQPNLMNLAKENKWVPQVNIRNMFVAEEENSFLRPDYMGQELRILASNANDERMLNAFDKGWDVHMFVANRSLGLGIPAEHLCETHPEYPDVREKHDTSRTKYKAVGFGIAYGKTSHGFAAEWGCSNQQAVGVIQSYFRMFPGVEKHIKQVHNFIILNGYSVTVSGRRRRYDKPIRKGDLRSGFNHTIQGGASDQIKMACSLMWRWFQEFTIKPKIVLTIHDEVIIEAPSDKIHLIKDRVESIMCGAMKLRCPVKVESKITHSYGDD